MGGRSGTASVIVVCLPPAPQALHSVPYITHLCMFFLIFFEVIIS